MSFADIPELKNVKASFFTIAEGNPVMGQILSPSAQRFYIHTVKTSDGKFIRVEHKDNCVICNNIEFRERYKPYYSFRVVMLNVTPVIRCPKCNTAYSTLSSHKTPERCLQDGTDLSQVKATPLGEPQILDGGVTLFKNINAIVDMMSKTKENFNLGDVVFMFTATGSGMKKVVTILPRTDIPVVEYVGDLPDTSLPEYTDTEVLQVLNGVPISKIYEMRKAARQQASQQPASTGIDFAAALGLTSLPGL